MRQFIYNQDQINEIIEFLKDRSKIPSFIKSKTAQYHFLKRSNNFQLIDNKLYINHKLSIPIEKHEEVLQKLYDDPKTFQTGRDKFYSVVSEKYSNISLNQVMEFLKKQKPYQIHKQVHRESTAKSFVVEYPNKLWCCDTTRIDSYNGYGILLNCVDVFSKYAYSVPIKNLTAKDVIKAFEKIFADKKPEKIQFDNGTEFKNNEVEKFMENNNVKVQYSAPHSPSSQSHVEVFNRHLKRMLYQLMTKNNTRNYIQFLDSVIKNYNSTKNTTTKEKPIDLQEDMKSGRNLDQIVTAQQNIKSKSLKRMRENSKFEDEINIKDKVRVINENYKLRRKNPLIKGYIPQWSDETFIVKKIIPGNQFTKKRFVLNNNKTYFAWELQKINDIIDNTSLKN